VLLASHYALPHLGGIETALDAFARELAARGHEVGHVASAALRPDEPPEDASAAAERPYELVRVPALNTLERRAGVPYPLFSPRLLAALRPRVARADVVHAHGYLYLSSLATLGLARRAAGQPVRVLTEHVAQVPYSPTLLAAVQAGAAGTVGRVTARAAQGLVALNETVERELARLAPGRPRLVAGNGVDTTRHRPPTAGERSELRARLGWSDDAPRVLFVGRLVAKKGLPVALEAARRDPGMRLVVAGPGDPPRDVPPNVELLGALTPDRVAELYRAADAFLLPSRGEGFPVTVQEAMASGLPVVLGRDVAYGRQLEGAGLAVRQVETSAGAVLAGLRSLLDDPGTRAQASRDAVAHARARFGWPGVVEALLDFYAELASPAAANDAPSRLAI